MPVDKVCEYCGGDYRVKPSRAKESKFCCKDCCLSGFKPRYMTITETRERAAKMVIKRIISEVRV